MKELDFPHNDWWIEERPLIFTPHKPDHDVAERVNNILDSRVFSAHVRAGIDKLVNSSIFQQSKQILSLQELLRPLFCDTEINIQSDNTIYYYAQISP